MVPVLLSKGAGRPADRAAVCVSVVLQVLEGAGAVRVTSGEEEHDLLLLGGGALEGSRLKKAEG